MSVRDTKLHQKIVTKLFPMAFVLYHLHSYVLRHAILYYSNEIMINIRVLSDKR